MNIFLSLLIGGSFFFTMPDTYTGQLCVQIDNIAKTEGKIWIAIYSSDQTFLDRDQAILYSIEADADKNQKVDLGMLPYGEYAIAIFHDWNNNNELDFNWFGIPIEPFAFSGSLASKWQKPAFADVKFKMNQNRKILTLQLETWRNM